MVSHFAVRSAGTPKTKASALSREIANFIRLSRKTSSMPRGFSSTKEAVMEARQTGAYWPWNLSTVTNRTG